MCGIAGELYFKSRSAYPISAMARANTKQYQRGPDSGGLVQMGPLTLAHRRLKIFDLSEKAAQPMVNSELGLALVFNGAIYNYKELRTELESIGYHFNSDGDTEVLLKAYHAWGKPCIPRLHGMFAFAMWERDSGDLVLVRDRLGIKPIYYAATAEGFKFASTLPALLEFDGIDRSINKTALHYYLTFHAVPEPLTLLNGVSKLAPGTVLTVRSDGSMDAQKYWSLQFNENKADHSRNDADWVAATHDAMQLATDRQLAADVPVGVLLSGGLDSSLLVALAAHRRQKPIETFSIGFESAHGESGDEFYYSDLVAKHFKTRHHQMFISNRQLADALGDCVASMAEPMTSHDNIGFYLLSHEVAKHVKVVLSGQGADEIFGGYHWFQDLPQSVDSPANVAHRLLNTIHDHTYGEYETLVTPEYRTSNHAELFLRELCAADPGANAVDHMMTYESTFALANGPLERVDNMTMAASLEARVPFLDEAVVEVARAMPLRYKLPDGGKFAMKQLGRQLLPNEVVDRPKGYFPVPGLKHLAGDTLALMQEILSPRHVRERGIFDQQAIAAMLDRPADHLTPSGASKLWQVALLEYWLQKHGL